MALFRSNLEFSAPELAYVPDRRLVRRRSWLGRVPHLLSVGALVLFVGWAVGAGAAQDQPTPESAPEPSFGLAGIFPGEIPERIADSLYELPDSWRDWSDSVMTELGQLYGVELTTASDSRMTLTALRMRLDTLEKAIADEKYGKIKPALVGIRGALTRRVALGEAVLDTLTLDDASERKAALEKARQQVLTAAREAERYLKSIPNGEKWTGFLETARLKALASEKEVDSASLGVVQAAHQRLQPDPAADAAVNAFRNRPALRKLDRALAELTSAAERSLAAPDPAAVRAALASLVHGLEAHEATGSAASSRDAREAFRTLRRVAPDGGARVAGVIQVHFMNYNMRVAASESFVSRASSEIRRESGWVCDFILGADVSGQQVTTTHSGLELLPSAHGARFQVTVRGTVSSNTAGVKDQATVYTTGNHSFWGSKEVTFDGQTFKTGPASVYVDANNTNTGARTKLSGLPILGRMSEKIALREAANKRPEAEAIAASRVSNRIRPRMDTDVDKKFADANKDFQEKVVAPLKEKSLYPDAYHYRTTETRLDVGTRLMSVEELAGSTPPVAVIPESGLTLSLHETLMNHVLDRMDLAGRTMTDDELRAHVEKFFSELLARDISWERPETTAADGEGTPKTLTFAQSDPVRVRIGDGKLWLIVTASFQREGDKNIAEQRVTIPFTFTVEGDAVHVARTEVSVASVAPPESVAEQVAIAGVVRKKFESLLPAKQFQRKFKLFENREMEVSVSQVQATDGWLTITIE